MITITPTIEGNYQIIRLKGRLDSTTSPELEDYLDANDLSKHRGVVFEMTELDYISSAGMRVLLNASKKFKKEKTPFFLCGMQAHVLEVFEISGFDTFLDIYPSLKDILEEQLIISLEDGKETTLSLRAVYNTLGPFSISSAQLLLENVIEDIEPTLQHEFHLLRRMRNCRSNEISPCISPDGEVYGAAPGS